MNYFKIIFIQVKMKKEDKYKYMSINSYMKNIFITAVGKKDGMGSQVLSKILAIVYCKKNKFEYVHIPLKTLDVKYQDESGKKAYRDGKGNQWVLQWENLLNIGKDYKKLLEIQYDIQIDLTRLIEEKQITMKDNYLQHNFDPTKRINYYITKYPNKRILFHVKEFPKFDRYELQDYKDILMNLRQNSNLNRNILDKCGGFNEETITDDLDLSFRLLIAGGLSWM